MVSVVGAPEWTRALGGENGPPDDYNEFASLCGAAYLTGSVPILSKLVSNTASEFLLNIKHIGINNVVNIINNKEIASIPK